MTPFRIRRFIAPDGSLRILLLNADNQPVFWPNVYATIEYQQTGKSPETIEKVLRAIAMPGLWAASIGRDFEEDLRTGSILTYADAESLAPFMGLSLKSQLAAVDRWQTRDSAPAPKVVPITSAKLERRVLARARIERREADADTSAQKPASSEETASRIRWLAGYLSWRLQQRENAAARDQRSFDQVASDAKAGITRLNELAPIVDSATEDDERLEGFGPGVAEQIEVALLPNSPTNPFPKDPFLRARNYLLWRIFLDSGGRRGEIRWTKIEDIERSKRRLAILNSKTMARTVAVSPRTISAFEDYVEIYSRVIPLGARKNGYLFVTIKGKLLVNRSINRIFETVRSNVPDVPDFLSPHGLRRDWNDRFSRMIDDMPEGKRLDAQQEREIRGRTMAWAKGSKMHSRYDKRHIRESADAAAEKMFEKETLSVKTITESKKDK